MSKSRGLLLLIGLVAAVTLPAQTRFDEIRATGVLFGGIIATENYPFVYRGPSGEWQGYEIELLEQAAEILEVSLALRTYPDQESLLAAIAGSAVDLAFSKILSNPANSQRSFQTVPVAELGLVLVVNRIAYSRLRTSGDLVRDISDGTVPIAIPEEPVYERELTRIFPRARVEVMSADDDMWCCIERGEQIALALDAASVFYYFSRFPERGISLRVVPVDASATVVGLVPWQSERFWEWINILIEGQGNPATLNELSPRLMTGFEPRSDT